NEQKDGVIGGSPMPTGFKLGEAFSACEDVASTSSRADYEWVHPIFEQLNLINGAYDRFMAERGQLPNEEAGPIFQRRAVTQSPQWEALYNYIEDYRAWIRWKLTRKPWQIRRPQRRAKSLPYPET